MTPEEIQARLANLDNGARRLLMRVFGWREFTGGGPADGMALEMEDHENTKWVRGALYRLNEETEAMEYRPHEA